METRRKILTRHRKGDSIREISRSLNLSRNTIRDVIRNNGGTTTSYTRKLQPYPKLGEYIDHLEKLLRDNQRARPKRNAKQLYEELCLAGYDGSYSSVSRYISKWYASRRRYIGCALTNITTTLTIDTLYSAILKSYCENCTKEFDLHKVWIPTKRLIMKEKIIIDYTSTGVPKRTCLKCRECGEIVFLGEPYWTIILFKGYYEDYAFDPTENYVIHIYCNDCSKSKDFSSMDAQRMK